MSAARPVGVLLVDLGGPASEAEVAPFVERLLGDPSVIPLPRLPRLAVAAAASRVRAREARRRYRAIGGRSPLLDELPDLAGRLGEALGPGFEVRHGFRHARPSVDGAVRDLAAAGARRLVGLPAFPQASATTAGSCVAALREAAAAAGLPSLTTPSFPEAPGYLEALEAGAREAARDADHLLLVAHGLPLSHLRRGDPYAWEVERTARALERWLGTSGRVSLAYQSRLGPVRWVGPHLEDEVRRLGRGGVRALGVVPLSFACENLETRYDLDVELPALAARAGVERVRRAPAPGRHPAFVAALAELVRAALRDGGWTGVAP